MNRSRRAAFAGLTLAVVAVHGLVVGRRGPAPAAAPAAPAVAAVRVLPAFDDAAATPAVPAPAAPAPTLRPGPPRPASPVAGAAPRRAAPASPAPADALPVPQEPPPQGSPVYATRFAPPAVLRYRLRRGAAEGEVELRWQPDDAGYTVHLAATLEGAAFITQTSRGAFDAAGLAPQRFVDRRPRGVAAANFRRDLGLVSYSGPTVEHPLPAGAQDRLSWMFQLAAVVDAQPALAAAGGRISLPVFGARGDAGTWVFRVGDGDAAEEGLVRLRREAAGAYDAAVEVWLDPRRRHLPARLVLHGPGDGRPALELTLQASTP